jgi:dienelactone hydrolase
MLFRQNGLMQTIFSHGLTCNRTAYSGICRDFASHGYIVFALDHFDGTTYYSRLFDGDYKYWSSNHDFLDKELRES